jgi:hypothetical protein
MRFLKRKDAPPSLDSVRFDDTDTAHKAIPSQVASASGSLPRPRWNSTLATHRAGSPDVLGL